MIDFINVEKTYSTGVEALKGINFTIEDGEFVFIIGKSGSGKSTLLKCITCEERPTKGKVTIDNFDISHMSRALVPHLRRKIGMIYQDFRLIETKTVAENVAFAGEIIGVPKQSLMNTVQVCLSVVGLKEKADCYPQELSGGEQQRVAIARAMVNNPSLIVADEPTGNLDPETSEAIMAMLLEINRNGNSGNKTTVIICTHDSAMVDRMKQRVIEIEDGLITRDEKRSSYHGDVDTTPYVPHPSRTALYAGAIDAVNASSGLAFGDDAEYSDDYDDADYAAKVVAPSAPGLVFGETENGAKAVPAKPMPVQDKVPVPSFDESPAEEEKKVSDILVENAKSDNASKDIPEVKTDIKFDDKTEEPAEDKKSEESVPEKAEIIEINIPEEKMAVTFGDEEKAKPAAPQAPAAPVIPKAALEKAPAKDFDPDIADGEELVYSGKADRTRDLKREQKRKAREEKNALKEAKRQEKSDKKKKDRKPGFTPDKDIDIFPEDEE